MKALFNIVFLICLSVTCAFAHAQVEHLKEAYKNQGDAFFVPLYWLPETRQTVLNHIPDHQTWVGFETDYWKKIKEEDKLLLLNELGTKLDQLEGGKTEIIWQRVNGWGRISSQLSLMAGFLGEEEEFLDMAFGDPTLRPAFKWIIDKREPDFDTKFIGSTFASGELASFYPHLIQHLLDTSEKERLECFSRLFAQIAATKMSKAPQGGDKHSTTGSESN